MAARLREQYKDQRPFRPLDSHEAQEAAHAALRKLHAMELPDWFRTDVLERIHHAFIVRAHDSLLPNPLDRAEVSGLVRAAMGDNDHIAQARVVLDAYVSSFLQMRLVDQSNALAVNVNTENIG